ncbi:MerR family transcriptional regulator [Bradyrhizobium sp. S69]|uniref:MerR family transcriptional regulator n=1 Tax=Bradyrhizobium sp. S69 TaxID=1641856 RepID=UPI00131DDD95|nr:MerR family transcriptional regulator [Bradyrhizobium sp. S69]
MRIGELAERSGLTASRIRFYEASGLINAVERNANGYREYTTDAVVTLDIITGAQKAGFSLQEIRSLLPTKLGTWQEDKLLNVLKKKVADIEALRERLAQSKTQLLGIIETIETSPEGLSCDDNKKRVLNRIPKHRTQRPTTRAIASPKP